MISINYFLVCSVSLYAIGLYCLISKRNMIKLILGFEILVNAAHLNFIAFAANRNLGYIDPLGQSIVVISIGFAGCAAALALTLVVYAYKHYDTLDVRKLRRLKG